MKRLARLGFKAGAVLVGLWALGQVLARRRTAGDEASDEFELAAYFGGVQRKSTATSLRRGVVRVCCGGVDLDLREAALDPAGATLELSATWGGVNVVVPPGWRVLIEDRSSLGGVDVRVPPPEELPDDAPELRVDASARMGGVAIRAAEPADPSSTSDHELRGWAAT
jgi:hypothetical protein